MSRIFHQNCKGFVSQFFKKTTYDTDRLIFLEIINSINLFLWLMRISSWWIQSQHGPVGLSIVTLHPWLQRQPDPYLGQVNFHSRRTSDIMAASMQTSPPHGNNSISVTGIRRFAFISTRFNCNKKVWTWIWGSHIQYRTHLQYCRSKWWAAITNSTNNSDFF